MWKYILAILIVAALVFAGLQYQNTMDVNTDADTNTGDTAEITDETSDEEMNEETSDDEMEENSDENSDDETTEETSDETAAGSFQDYDTALVAAALQDDKTVVLDFAADRCPICQQFKADVEANPEAIPADLAIFRVDFDTADELKARYNVTSQHTFVVIDENMEEVNKLVGPSFDEVMAL